MDVNDPAKGLFLTVVNLAQRILCVQNQFSWNLRSQFAPQAVIHRDYTIVWYSMSQADGLSKEKPTAKENGWAKKVMEMEMVF